MRSLRPILRLAGVLAVVATLVTFTARGALAIPATDVSGTITTTDPSGAPVAAAFVVLTEAGGQKYSAVTDATGAWTVSGDQIGAVQALLAQM